MPNSRNTPLILRRQTGVVLVFVLILLVLLTVMAGSFSQSMRNDAALVHNIKNRIQVSAMTDAGIAHAQFMLTQPDQAMRWRSDAREYDISFDGHAMAVAIQDEAGKFDLNRLDAQMLLNLLEPLLETQEQATMLRDRILDWRDSDDDVREYGAERDDNKDEQLYMPANRPFKSIRELYRVQGMTEAVYHQLSSFVTVQTRQQKVDVGVAPEYLLAVLPGSDPIWVEHVLATRLSEPQAAKSISIPPVMAEYASVKMPQRGQFFSITVMQKQQDGGTLKNKVLMRKNSRGVFPLFTEIERELQIMDSQQPGEHK